MGKIIKKLSFFAALLLFSAGCARTTPPAAVPLPAENNYSRALTVGNQTLMVEVVTDSQKMETGLSGRNFMADNQGMLFDFGSPQKVVFWMKDMEFNLDFLWIEKNPSTGLYAVIGVTTNVPAPKATIGDDRLPTYAPPSAVNWVLEVNAGWSKAHNIQVGDEVKLIDKN